MSDMETKEVAILAEKMDGLRSLIFEKFNDNFQDHFEIKKKQDHTNGDVGKLKAWMNRVIGGLAVISAIVIPLAIYVLNHWSR